MSLEHKHVSSDRKIVISKLEKDVKQADQEFSA